jgi:broad specificity phosphatase PhoE
MTAYIIGQDLGHTGEIIRATELREVSFGDLAGQPEVEVEDFYQHLQNALTFKPPHGEALGAMQKRVVGFLRDVSKEKQAYTQPLLVT